MPTNLNKDNLRDMGNTTDAKKIENVVNTADTTLISVEKIAGKVENIMGMITKFKEMGGDKKELPASVAVKTEKGLHDELPKQLQQLKNTAKIKINNIELEKKITELINSQDETKTIKKIKSELELVKKAGMFDKLLNEIILNNCEVVFE